MEYKTTILLLAVILPLALSVSVQGETSSVLQTGLTTEKMTYKMDEGVYAMLLLYNPSSQRVVLHFTDGCWFDFIIRDAAALVVHNQTWPICDPDVNGFENTTGRATIDPGGGRNIPMSWNQLDQSGRQVPVPGEYTLSWRLKSIEPVPEAATTVTLDGQPLPQGEATAKWFKSFAVNFGGLLLFPLLFIGFLPVYLDRNLRTAKWTIRLLVGLPGLVAFAVFFYIYETFFFNRFYCYAIDCSATISLLATIAQYLWTPPLAWAGILAVGIKSPTRIRLPIWGVLEASVAASWLVSSSVLLSMENLWRHMYYFNWEITGPSYAVLLASVPALWLGHRMFVKRALSVRLPAPPTVATAP